MIERLKDLWAHRELLWNMTVKELKVKYKRSVLGFAWSFMTPLVMLLVFSIVFSILARGGDVQWYAVFLMSGLLPWLFFVNSLMQSVGSIVANPGLVKKVYFPREILPIAAVGANIFHFVLQMLVFFVFMLLIRWHFSPWLLLMPFILILQVVLTLGLALLVSAANVYLRDVQHFVEVALTALFWLSPIVYPVGLVASQFPKFMPLYLVNPMTNIVLLWEYAIYNPHHYGPQVAYISFWGILITVVFSIVTLVGGYYVFARIERGFAEQI
ncbi:MAG: ABC transporter permease [Actinobacteria bacterium]|nr:ABC transporter permease [Actinomycetota bacterium]MCG2817454.1 ABC transporter permease [Actinomycetes bacterium]MBU4178502.1 ABC transporter permease [Actinomycetota bacterium]MBU4217937.1 ABC transporter permease [Actinomycetota bacterium]MBU4360030.1 ABC transporter permease [Actinomycetota bacterium]